jgi:hypothetical protein
LLKQLLCSLVFSLLMALLLPETLPAQGMGSTTRAARRVNVQTGLPPITVNFKDIAVEAGLTAENVSGGETAKSYIIETTGNGVAVFDFDNDGLMDIFLPNGTTLDGDGKGKNATSHLYRNLGGLKFEDVTKRAGLDRVGWGQGVCVGDYDNDGHRDLFAAYYGHSALYRNNGDGTFQAVTKEMDLLAKEVRWDAGCSFFDYNLDGKLDLMITGYLSFDRQKIPKPGSNSYCQWKGIPVMCGPRGLPFTRNYLFRNDGGKFTDVSEASGIRQAGGCYGFTPVASDFDNDGYPDIYVACDSTPSLLFHNQKDGTFEEVGVLMGVALNEDGQEQGGMGVAVGDYDEDGHVDILKTNFSDDVPNVYHNNGDGSFEDRVYQAGLGGDAQYVGWGIQLIDLDHDGLRDVLIVNGHVYPEVEKNPAMRYRQSRQLYWNVGGGKFIDITAKSGPAITEAWSSRGSAVGDLDNDGSLEVVISNMGARPSLLKNYGPKQNWLLVQCEGVKANRDGVGARVYVYAAGRRVSGEIQTGASYLSQHDARAHFGLAGNTKYERIEVQWPGGAREVFPGGSANRIVKLKQGEGSVVKASGQGGI